MVSLYPPWIGDVPVAVTLPWEKFIIVELSTGLGSDSTSILITLEGVTISCLLALVDGLSILGDLSDVLGLCGSC